MKARQTSTFILPIRSPSGAEVTPISLAVSSSSASYTGSLAAGTYLLALELVDGESSVARYVDTVLIVQDLTAFGSALLNPRLDGERTQQACCSGR